MTLQTYIPQDRLRALAHGKTLPNRTSGAALFADISGFTPLTRALRDALGARQCVQELTSHRDTVYTALITEVERYDGSVIGFAGDAITTPYHTWKTVSSAFFGVDPELPLRKQIRLMEGSIEDHAPECVEALPLLGAMLNLEIPESDFTKTLEPKDRKVMLHALLEDCLKAAAQDEPLLIIIEDLHWIDALSHDMFEELARALTGSRICFVLAYRPQQLKRLMTPRLEALVNFTKIELSELTPAECKQTIRAKLAQLYPSRSGAVPPLLVEKLMARAQGNPFYLEEMLNFLRDRGLDPRDPHDLNKIELPDSLHTLILSRVDQLSEREKTTLRVASIIGRLFRAEWLTGYYPTLGGLSQVQDDLEQLILLDITSLDTPEPELTYLFKYIITHEVTYVSLPFATRGQLHEQLAKYLEGINAPIDTIAHHFGQSNNQSKQREYYQKAGDAMQEAFANYAAADYFTRLLEKTPKNDPACSTLALQLANVHFGLGNFPAASAAVQQAQSAAMTDDDHASALALLGRIMLDLGDFTAETTMLTEAMPLARASCNQLVLCLTLIIQLGVLYWVLGKLDDARAAAFESLELARALSNAKQELRSLMLLGLVATDSGEEERFYKEVYTRAMAAGDRERALTALSNLGVVLSDRKDYTAAHEYTQQALAFAREISAQDSIANNPLNLAANDVNIGQLVTAQVAMREGLALALRLGALPRVVGAMRCFAYLAYAKGETKRALVLNGLASHHPAWRSDDQRDLDATVAEWAPDPSVAEVGLKKGVELDWDETVKELLR